MTNSPTLYSSHFSDSTNANENNFVFLLHPQHKKEHYNKPILCTPFPLLFLSKVQLWSSVFQWLENKDGLLRNKEWSRIKNKEVCLFKKRVYFKHLAQTRRHRARNHFPLQWPPYPSWIFKKGLEFLVGKEIQTLETFLDLPFSGYTSGNNCCDSNGRSSKEFHE